MVVAVYYLVDDPHHLEVRRDAIQTDQIWSTVYLVYNDRSIIRAIDPERLSQSPLGSSGIVRFIGFCTGRATGWQCFQSRCRQAQQL